MLARSLPAGHSIANPDNPPWRCFYTIEFPDGETKRSYIRLESYSVQALLLAVAGATHKLRYVGNGTPAARSPIQWLGEDDLDLIDPAFRVRQRNE